MAAVATAPQYAQESANLNAISESNPSGTDEANHNHRLSQISTASSSNSKRAKAHIGPWQLGRTLGRGSSGRVRLAKNSETGQLAAVKIVPKATTGPENSIPYGIEREVIIMKLIEHPNIMALYDVWENKGELYLVLEYVEGGELFDYLVSRGRLSEHEAVHYFRQICYGVDYCHQFNICHRDLKPENLLLDKHRNIKIADFGMAALETNGQMLETSCGSPHYASPEIVAGKTYHGAPSDIWSCGIILFALLTGHLPFDDDNIRQLLLKVQSGKYSMPKSLSPEAHDLITRILRVEPSERITMAEILNHPLLLKYPAKIIPEENLNNRPILTDASRPVKSVEDIDRDILRQLQTLWHREDSKNIIDQLLHPDPNPEKTFYCLLLRFRQKHGLSIGPDNSSNANASKSHRRNVSSVSRASKSSVRSKRHHHHPKRSGSRFSVTSNSSRRTRNQIHRRNLTNMSHDASNQSSSATPTPPTSSSHSSMAAADKAVKKDRDSANRECERDQFADMLDMAFKFTSLDETKPSERRTVSEPSPSAVSAPVPVTAPAIATATATPPPATGAQSLAPQSTMKGSYQHEKDAQFKQRASQQPTTATAASGVGRNSTPAVAHREEDRRSISEPVKTLDPWYASMAAVEPKYLLPIVFEEDRFADALEEEMELKVYRRRRAPVTTLSGSGAVGRRAAGANEGGEDDSRLQIANLASGESFYSYQPSAAAAAVPPPQRPAPSAPKLRHQSSEMSFSNRDSAIHIGFQSSSSRVPIKRKPAPSDQQDTNTALMAPKPVSSSLVPKINKEKIDADNHVHVEKRTPLGPRETNIAAPKQNWFRRFTPKRLSSGPTKQIEPNYENSAKVSKVTQPSTSSAKASVVERPQKQNAPVAQPHEEEEEVRQNWFLKILTGAPADSTKRILTSSVSAMKLYESTLRVLADAAPHGLSASAPPRSDALRKSIIVSITRRNSLRLRPATLSIKVSGNASAGKSTIALRHKRGSHSAAQRLIEEIERSLRRLQVLD